MTVSTKARVLRVYVGDQDRRDGAPLHLAIVNALRAAGLANVSVFHGVEGYGAHRQLHTQRIEVLIQGLPVVVEAVDTPDAIDRALPLLDALLVEGLVVFHDVDATTYHRAS